MTVNFDEIIERRGTDSGKWSRYGADVLPLWVADMDFRAAEPILRALHERIEHGVFGYGGVTERLRETISERLSRLYAWDVEPDLIALMPGVIPGFNLAAQAVAGAGAGVLMQTPVYPPFLVAPRNSGAKRQELQLTRGEDGRYEIDFDRFEAAIDETTRIFILCNPHNPVGRVWTPLELARMAEICAKHEVVICSDEIHCDLIYSGHQHVPIASLSPEIAQNTITLMSPSKSFNLPGLYCSFAVIQNPKLCQSFREARRGLVGPGNLLGFTAGLSAYTEAEDWLAELVTYLEGNRDFLFETIRRELPMLKMAKPEGTYLAWLDCSQAGIDGLPGEFFLKQAKVGLEEGKNFGRGGEGFVRLNFGCPRATLQEALERMKAALASVTDAQQASTRI